MDCGKSETSISKQSCLFFGPHSIWTATGSTAPLKEILLLSVNPSCRSFSEMSKSVPFNSGCLQTKKAYHLRSKKEGKKDPFCKYQCPNFHFSKMARKLLGYFMYYLHYVSVLIEKVKINKITPNWGVCKTDTPTLERSTKPLLLGGVGGGDGFIQSFSVYLRLS